MRLLLSALLLAALALPAWAQAPITIVVNFAAGGSADRMARLLAPEMTETLGAQVVVKNTTGASGAIGAAEVARARPDGHTLLLTTVGPVAIQPSFRSDLPYRPADLVPVCQVGDAPLVLMTTPASGIRDVAGLLQRARTAPGGINYGSVGPGSLPHIAMAALVQQTGVPMTHVPFRGSSEAVIALMRDDVSLYADLPGAVRINNLVAIGVAAERRAPEFPDVPTMREQGVDLVTSIWAGLFATAGTPPATLARLEGACQRALRAPAVIEGFERLSTPIVFRGQQDFATFWRGELEMFQGVVRAAGLRATD